jgi:hypothetical protein
MTPARRYRFFITADGGGKIEAWASDRAVESGEALAQLRDELLRATAPPRAIAAGSHDEPPTEWAAVGWHRGPDGRVLIDTFGLAADEREARYASLLFSLRGGEGAAVRIRLLAMGPLARFDYTATRVATQVGASCRSCGLPTRTVGRSSRCARCRGRRA